MRANSFKSILIALPCITACCVLVWFGYVQVPQCFDGSSPHDFPNYYFGGQRLLEGRPIYSNLHDDVMNKFGWEYNVYPADPPFAVAALSTLSLMPYKPAWWTLAIFSFISICAVVLLTAREALLSKDSTLITLSIAACSPPFLYLVKRNHFEMALVLCSVLGWMALRRARPSSGSCYFWNRRSTKAISRVWLLAPLSPGGSAHSL